MSAHTGPLQRLRADALACAQAGVEAVRAARLAEPALRQWLATEAGTMTPVVIAAGKAAGSMLDACVACGIEPRAGVIASTHLPLHTPPGVQRFVAGHPVPNPDSERAALAALALAGSAGPDDRLLVLLSGGASAILAAPAPGIALADKVVTTKLLLEAGAAIHEVNAVRKHLSAIKGGQLAAAAGCPSITMALSDVVGNDPSVIGSGPTVADPSTFADALAVLDRFALRDRVPAPVRERLEAGARGEVAETPKPGDARLGRAEYVLVGSRAEAMDAARAAAIDRGYATVTIEAPLVGEARDAGPRFLNMAVSAAQRLPRPACVIVSGETTVRVTGKGKGGRNQELCLASVERLAALGAPAVLVSVGTDGIDGPTDAAGAVADSSTLQRARDAGLPPAPFLADNDAYTFFDRLGDLVRTGPSDTNVGDLQILVIA
ncbi:MAG TPA: DUF4147 domain-containing protein [Vicinamibacterales bacterium]